MFENKKIKLRKTTMDDAVVYHTWRNNIEVMASTSPLLDVYTWEDTQHFFEMISRAENAKSYMIEEKETKATIGIASLVQIDLYNRNAELIIDIGESSVWGKGYGKEVISLLLNYAFKELNLHKIYLRVFSFNARAIGLYKKLGFEVEGQAKEMIFRDGQWHDIISMGILQQDYLKDSIQ